MEVANALDKDVENAPDTQPLRVKVQMVDEDEPSGSTESDL